MKRYQKDRDLIQELLVVERWLFKCIIQETTHFVEAEERSKIL